MRRDSAHCVGSWTLSENRIWSGNVTAVSFKTQLTSKTPGLGGLQPHPREPPCAGVTPTLDRSIPSVYAMWKFSGSLRKTPNRPPHQPGGLCASRPPHVRNIPFSLAASFEPDLYHPTTMATRTRKARVSSFDDRIDILRLKSIAVEGSPAYQLFRTVSVILALVRVCALIPCPPVNYH